MRVTLQAVNTELAKLKTDVRLAKSGQYFYFHDGEAIGWLDSIVKVPTISSLTIEEWLQEFRRLQELNRGLLGRPTRTTKKSG